MSKRSPAKSDDCFFTVFSTSWGDVGALACPRGISRVVPPHYKTDALLQLLKSESPNAKLDDRPFEKFIAACRAYFDGDSADFSALPCALPSADSFDGKVHRACQAIPPGQTISYGELARQIGKPKAARAAAGALGRNKIPLLVPCHRVINSSGRPGGFSAPAGPDQKIKLLKHEQIFFS